MTLITLWDMRTLSSAVLSQLSAPSGGDLNSVQRIHFALKFSIKGWIPSAVTQLVRRSDAPSASEIGVLGSDITAKIWSLREKNRSGLLDQKRAEVHQTLFRYGGGTSMRCGCVTCQYARQITGTNISCKPIEEVDYSNLMPGIETEILQTEISDPSM
jgi:hypothetical protein